MPRSRRDLPASQVRQGRPGKPVLAVLVLSLALAVVVVAIVWLAQAGGLARADRSAAPTAAEAQKAHAPAPRSPS